jgi:histidine ammonia-lyase
VQAFTMALGEAMAGSVQRVLRFPDPFFTVIAADEVLSEEVRARAPQQGASYSISDLMAEIQVLATPVPAQGMTLVRNVEDMESYTRQRVASARLAVDNALRLVAHEMLSASYWVEVRRTEGPTRSFAEAPMAVLEALRAVLPWQAETAQRPERPVGEVVYEFMRDTPAAQFFDATEP